MGCPCKGNDPLIRAKRLVGRTEWDKLRLTTQGQVKGLYKQKFGVTPTDEQVKQWIYG